VNVWTIMSADEKLGYVYLPFSPAANDHYGGERPGDNLFAESLVTHAHARYSSLDQITRDNAQHLRIAWRWVSPDRELMARQ
jgi:glucose dehydrogenase